MERKVKIYMLKQNSPYVIQTDENKWIIARIPVGYKPGHLFEVDIKKLKKRREKFTWYFCWETSNYDARCEKCSWWFASKYDYGEKLEAKCLLTGLNCILIREPPNLHGV